MRGDGGSAGHARRCARHPLLTAFSGPAASVAGALRHLAVLRRRRGRGGRHEHQRQRRQGRAARLAYVRVLDHVTCVRSLDVRVGGIGGGSLLRVAALRPVADRRRRAAIGAHCRPRRTPASPIQHDSTAPSRAWSPRARATRRSTRSSRHHPERRFAITLTCAANALEAFRPARMRRATRHRPVPRSPLSGACSASRANGWRSRHSRQRPGRSHRSSTTSSPSIASRSRSSSASAGRGRPHSRGRSAPEARMADPARCRGHQLGRRCPLPGTYRARARDRRPGRERDRRAASGCRAAAIEAGADPEALQIESETDPERRLLRGCGPWPARDPRCALCRAPRCDGGSRLRRSVSGRTRAASSASALITSSSPAPKEPSSATRWWTRPAPFDAEGEASDPDRLRYGAGTAGARPRSTRHRVDSGRSPSRRSSASCAGHGSLDLGLLSDPAHPGRRRSPNARWPTPRSVAVLLGAG